jgi:hypothetical protein
MLLLRRAQPAAAPRPAGELELSHTLVPLPGSMSGAWPIHARRCLHRLPERLKWATPVLDPRHPHALACTHDEARALLLWLHHLPSFEHPIVGCHRRRPA